jgi:ABC-type Mn2+/Zn2+ transport system ATPase subunit
MLESEARLVERTIHVKGRKYKQLIIYMPRSLATDSAFPFKPKEMLRISILGDSLKVRKAELPHATPPIPDTMLPIVEILSPLADNVDEDDN